VAGVRGSVSNDLIEAAGGVFEPLEFEPVAADQKRDAFIRFVDRLERSKPFITFKYVAAAMTTSIEFPGVAEDEARDYVAQAIEEGILRKEQRADGYRVLILDRAREDVDGLLGQALNGSRRPPAELDGEDDDPIEDDDEFYDEDGAYDDLDDDESPAAEVEEGHDAPDETTYGSPRGGDPDERSWNR